MWIPLVCKNFLRLLGSFCNQVVRTSASSNHLSPNQIFGLGLYCDVYIGASGYILCSSNTTRSAPPVPNNQSHTMATLGLPEVWSMEYGVWGCFSSFFILLSSYFCSHSEHYLAPMRPNTTRTVFAKITRSSQRLQFWT